MENPNNPQSTPTTGEPARSGPALYVGTYAKYNAGSIRGAWLRLEDYADNAEFLSACRELHKDEADPELMFQDFEDMPRALYDESSGAPRFWEVSEACDRHGVDLAIAAIYAEHVGDKLDADTVEAAAENYMGTFRSREAFAEHLCAEMGDLEQMPEHLRPYFDYEAYARDLFCGDYFDEDTDEGLAVFASR